MKRIQIQLHWYFNNDTKQNKQKSSITMVTFVTFDTMGECSSLIVFCSYTEKRMHIPEPNVLKFNRLQHLFKD